MAVATVDFRLKPDDGWVKVATNPALLYIRPSVFRPWRLAMTAAGAPAALTAATGVLTLTANAGNAETVTIGGKVYTFQTVLTNVDGNVLIGATASASIDNLIAAINLGAGAGTTYAAATTLHPSVSASAGAGDTMDVKAKTPGAAGNSIATTETLANGSFGAATLTGGSDELRGMSFGQDTYKRLEMFERASAITAEVYVRVDAPSGYDETAHFSVIRDQ